jgi:HPt (histidine-containing phosphotransfer) domain-containing protein
MSRSKGKASVVNHGDHEVIVPQNNLRTAVSKASAEDDGEDPIARAEKALAALSSEFAAWMSSECGRLDDARREIVSSGFTDANKEALFRAAHDIKGEAATFGYPAMASAAESLCRLIEHAPVPHRIPAALIEQHVDAVRAIHREYGHADAQKLATALTIRLREVTDDFLMKENQDRPDVLKQLRSPSIVPR